MHTLALWGKRSFRRLRLLFCLFAVIALTTAEGATTPAEAGENSPGLKGLSIEQLMDIEVTTVMGASRYEQKETEAPSAITIVTADEIRKFGYRTLANILQSARSFYLTYDRNYSYIGVRGFNRPGDYNSRVLILVDGHPTNDNVYGMGSAGTEFILDVDLIDRVEIIRGPGSSLYGSNAFFAVVNVITKRGRDLSGAEVSGEAASFSTYGGRISYGNRSSTGLEAIISASAFDSKGPTLFFPKFDSPAQNNGITGRTDYDRAHRAFAKLSYGDFALEAAYVSRTKGIPTASFGTDFNDPRNQTTDTRAFVDLKFERSLNALTDISARLSYDRYDYSGDYVYSGVINKDFGKGEWWRAEVKLAAQPWRGQKVVLGAEYQDNLRQEQENYDEDPYYLYLKDRRRSENWASYIQDEFKISPGLILNAGIRYDHYTTFGGTTNPRLALIYNPSGRTTLKLLYGRAFRAPNDYELYYQSPPSQKSNPGLRPETIRTFEAVAEQYLGSHMRATAAGFYYKIKDLITQTINPSDASIVYQNVAEIEAKGFEFELEGKWESGLEGRISYTFQDSRNLTSGSSLANSPRHLAKASVVVPLVGERVFAGIEEQFTSGRKTLSGNDAPGFFISNLTLFGRNVLRGLEISGSIYNLFNRHYADPGAEEHWEDIIPQDGRTFRVKLTYAY
jgi:outer membrane receptor for ferrienterochelin and colicins